MDIEIIKRLAINEVINPTFELTKQIQSINKIIYKNDLPVVEDVIINDRGAEVYFPIEQEQYYFVVYVDTEPNLKLRFMGTSPGTEIYLWVSSETNDLDELLNILNLEPEHKWRKGERKKYTETEICYESKGLSIVQQQRKRALLRIN